MQVFQKLFFAGTAGSFDRQPAIGVYCQKKSEPFRFAFY